MLTSLFEELSFYFKWQSNCYHTSSPIIILTIFQRILWRVVFDSFRIVTPGIWLKEDDENGNINNPNS